MFRTYSFLDLAMKKYWHKIMKVAAFLAALAAVASATSEFSRRTTLELPRTVV